LNLIDRYLLREWLKILVLVLSATVGLLLIQAMYDDFRDLLDKGADVSDIVVYFAIKTPSFLAIVMPIILLVSLLFTLGQLHRNNEIIALRAAGVGIFRITRSIWVSGVLLCGVVWALNASVVPWSVEASRALLEEIDFRHQSQSTPADHIGITRVVTFDNQRQGRMWFINRYSRFVRGGKAFGVMVSELDPQRREKTRILAREAQFDLNRHCWVFHEGRESWIDPESGEVTRTVPFAEKVVAYFNDDPGLMLLFDVKPGELSLFQLREIIDYFTIQENPKVTAYAVRYFGLLADTLSPLIIIAIAIPFAISGVRVNPAVGVSKSIGLFLLYFVLLKAAGALGSRSIIDPLFAAWVPNLAMLGVGTWFFLRMK
jgi:lipopolysaccharide export system permease protein